MSTARDRRIGKPTGNENLWRWGLEADPGRQVRRLARAARGESTESQLRRAVAGRTVLVTGASAGIGREVAHRLGAVGAELLLVARRRDRLEELADELRGTATVHVLPCDLMDLDAVDALAARVLAQHGSADVLVNNAGHSIRRAVWRQTDRLHDFERVMRLNYFAALHLTLPLVAEMRRRRDGHVVNVSTLGTQFGPEPRFAGYLGSKGALDAFARSAAAETGRDGVHWTTVHMPLVRTDMITPTDAFREFPALSPPRAAQMVIDGIIRRPVRVSHPYGVALHTVDLIAPRRLERAMGKAMGRGGSPGPVGAVDEAGRVSDNETEDTPAGRSGTRSA